MRQMELKQELSEANAELADIQKEINGCFES